MTALARKLRRMSPEAVQRVRLKPHEYVELVAAHITGADKASPRLCYLVLHAIAERAHWQTWQWGGGSVGSVENIAEDICYSPRAVRYALSALTGGAPETAGVRAGRWLRIEQRDGRTNVITVLRPVEPLQPVKRPGEAVENRPAADALGIATVAGGIAKVATDLFPPTRDNPPVVPPSGLGTTMDGADAPAQAAAQCRGSATRPPSAAAAPSLAGPGARPHRGDAGAPGAVGSAALDVVAPEAGADGPVTGPAASSEGAPTSYRLSRRIAKSQHCPRCGVAPGEACVTVRGRPREATHNERRVPLRGEATTAPTSGARMPDWCGQCNHADSRFQETPTGGWIKCPACHPLYAAPPPF